MFVNERKAKNPSKNGQVSKKIWNNKEKYFPGGAKISVSILEWFQLV